MRYGAGPDILRAVSFILDPGSFHFVIGPSGAGKSSLLKLMYLAMRPAEGSIELFGRDVHRLSRAEGAMMRRRIGVVFQDFRLLPHLTAQDNVALPLRVAGQSGSKVRDHVVELLSWVGLAEHVDALPPTLSGGQQQRVAIARAVIGNVDDRIALRLLYLFEELNKLGTTVVIATHNEAMVRRFQHPALRLMEGSVSLDSVLPSPPLIAGPEGVPA